MWKDGFELEAYWNKLRVDDYTLATVGDTTTYSFALPDEYRSPIINQNKYLKLILDDGTVISKFKMVDPNQRVVDDAWGRPDRAAFVGRNVVLSRAPKATEVGATIVLDVVEFLPALTRTDDSALELLPNKQLAALGVAKTTARSNLVKANLSPSFVQEYNDELKKAIAENNLTNELNDIQREDYSYIGGIW